ncbi:hypothetical protein ACFFHJ_33425 [Planotetraspora thailandica]|uniref:hypothetical protein n=1 Tax=Planotetraspora thailandica TaxID=487172 RepID=UPI001950C05D|nr:hypothetical protein [Planotetraspora thailandica]
MISLISYYIDLAIGLILAFLLLSLLVSGLNEGIVRLLGIRSKFLWAYLRDTLDGAEAVNKVSSLARMVERVLETLKGLGRRMRRPLLDLLPPEDRDEGRSRLPATVLGVFAKLPFGKDPRPPFAPVPAPVESPPLAAAPGTVAAEQVADTTVLPGSAPQEAVTADPAVADPAHPADQADPEERAAPQVAVAGHGKSMAELLHERLQEIDQSKRGKTTIAEIPPSRFAVALMEIATERGGIEPLMAELDTLKSPLYRPLKAVWDKANNDLEAFRRGVEEWFDGEMQRLSLLYKRYVRWVVALLSLVVTLFFSMDALEYGKTLLTDSAYRSAVTAFADSGPEALEPLREQCAAGQDTYTCVTDVLSTPAFVKIFTHAPVSATMESSGPSWAWHPGGWWDRLSSLGHWPGYLLTLIAILFGAPFWWDMLRRVTGLRSRLSSSAKQ